MQQASKQASMHSGIFYIAIFFHCTYDKYHHNLDVLSIILTVRKK